MNEPVPCPPAADVATLIGDSEYAEFGAGWRDGVSRCIASPAPIEILEDLALLLEAADLVERISPPA